MTGPLSMANLTDKKSRQETADEVHSVWNAVDDLRTDVSSIKSSQASLVAKFDQVFAMFQQIHGDRKTPWGVIISAMTFLAMLGMAIGGAALAPLYLMDSVHGNALKEHVSQDGHPIALQRHAAMERDVARLDGDIEELKETIKNTDLQSRERQTEVRDEIDNLDIALQREMRDLDVISDTKIANLDSNLQREMRMLSEIQDAKRDSISSRDKDNTERDKAVGSRLSALEVKHAERMSALEVMLNKVMREQENRTNKAHKE